MGDDNITIVELKKQLENIVGTEKVVKTPSHGIARCTVSTYKEYESVLDIAQKFFDEKFGEKYPDLILCYRGQKRADWTITPKIARTNQYGKEGLQKFEDSLINDFIKSRDKHKNKKTQKSNITVKDIMEAQHYGIPTRMIDVSTNKDVALWFACESFSQANGKECTGEVFVIPCLDRRDIKFEKYMLYQIKNYKSIMNMSVEQLKEELKNNNANEYYGMKPFNLIDYPHDINGSKRIKNQEGRGILVPIHTYETKGKSNSTHSKYSTISKWNLISIKINPQCKNSLIDVLDKDKRINEEYLFADNLDCISKYITNKYTKQLKEKEL